LLLVESGAATLVVAAVLAGIEDLTGGAGGEVVAPVAAWAVGALAGLSVRGVARVGDVRGCVARAFFGRGVGGVRRHVAGVAGDDVANVIGVNLDLVAGVVA